MWMKGERLALDFKARIETRHPYRGNFRWQQRHDNSSSIIIEDVRLYVNDVARTIRIEENIKPRHSKLAKTRKWNAMRFDEGIVRLNCLAVLSFPLGCAYPSQLGKQTLLAGLRHVDAQFTRIGHGARVERDVGGSPGGR